MLKEHSFVSRFEKEDFVNSRVFVDKLEEVLEQENLSLVEQSGEDHMVVKKTKKRRGTWGSFPAGS